MTGYFLHHPSRERLANFVAGRLSGPELLAIETHLETCDTCADVLATVPLDRAVRTLQAAASERATGDTLNTKGEIVAQSAELTIPHWPMPHGTMAPHGIPPTLAEHPRYRITGLVGVGGMGAVYRAEHMVMRRPVALKIVRHELVNHPAAVQRFRREVEAAAKLVHPNIVTAFDAELVGDTHFLVMEFVEGRSLAAVVADSGPLPIEQACEYIRQAALGMQHAHERGMVHRDIKPHNLMLTTDGTVKILDFGLARFASEISVDRALTGLPSTLEETTNTLSRTGLIFGTPDYIAPEQAGDPHSADIRADIYSLGCTLYFLLAGQVVYPGDSKTKKLADHRNREFPSLAKHRPDVPVDLDEIIARMTAKDPNHRFQSPGEVAIALDTFLRDRRDLRAAVPETPVESAKPMRASRSRWLGVGIAAAVLLFGIAAWQFVVVTAKGDLVVKADDESIAVTIKREGVVILDRTTDRQIRLKTGSYIIETTGPADLVVLPHNQVTIERGRTVTVEIARQQPDLEAGKDPIELSSEPQLDVNFQDGQAGFPTISDAGKGTWFDRGAWVYQIRVPSESGFGQLAKPQPGLMDTKVEDFVFETEVAAMPGGVGTWALCFSFDWNGKRWMYLNVDTSGMISVTCKFEPKKVQYAIPTTATPSMRPRGEFNRVRLEVIAHRIRVFVNGTFVAEGSEPRQFASALYLGLLAQQAPVEFRFRRIRLWSLDRITGQDRSFDGHAELIRDLAYSPDGDHIATASWDGSVRVWNAESGKELLSLHHPGARSVAFSEDGRQLVSAGLDKFVRLWSAESGKELGHFEGHVSPEIAVTFLRDGERLVSGGGSGDNSIRIWDAATGKVMRQIDGHSDAVFDVAVSPDGRRIASASYDGTCAVWEVESGTELARFRGHTDKVTCIAFSPDGTQIASSGFDRQVRLWNAATGVQTRAYTGHTGTVEGIDFSRDGSRIASASHDGTIRVWDARTGLVVCRLAPETASADARPAAVCAVAFLPNGNKVASGGHDRRIRVWRLPPRDDSHRRRALVMDANAASGWLDFHQGNHEYARMAVVGNELQYMAKLPGGWVAKPQDALSNRISDEFVFEAEFRLLAGQGVHFAPRCCVGRI